MISFKSFLNNTSDLDKSFFKTLLTTYFSKAVSLFSSFLVIPLVLDHLGQEKYGVLITMISILGWLYLLDLGIASSVKNLASKFHAINDKLKLSLTFFNALLLLSLIFIITTLIIIIVIPQFNWYVVFKTKSVSNSEINEILIYSAIIYLLNMLFSVGNNFLFGIQKGFINNYFNAIGSLLGLISIYIAIKVNAPMVFIINLYSGGFLFGNLMSLIYSLFYCKELNFNNIKFDKDLIRQIFQMGSGFFTLGIISVLIYTSNNILITQYIGPSKISEFDPIMRLNQLIIQASSLYAVSLWPAYTNAISRNDLIWAKNKFFFSLKITTFFFVLPVIILMIFGPQIVGYWLNGKSVPTIGLCISIGIWTIIFLFNQVFGTLINGAGLMKKQIKYGFLSIIIFLLTGIFLIQKFGLIGLSVAGIISSSVGLLANPFIIYKYLLNKKEIQNN
jgi:O-antigen/teichoic acid export membrane protein